MLPHTDDTFVQPRTTAFVVFWRFVWMILVEHIQSQRVVVEWGSAIGVALVLLRDSTNTTAVMGTWALYALCISLYTTSVLADTAEQPFHIQRLLAIQSRRMFLWAYMCASVIMAASCQLILMLVSILVAPAACPALLTVFASLPSIILIIMTATACMLLLTPLVSSVAQRISVLLVIAIPIAWGSIAPRLIPAEALHIKAVFNTVFGVMLWPSLHLYATAITPSWSLSTLSAYAVHLGICTLFILLATRWFTRKHITNI
ncbi:MAG: hypothetical protein ACKO83_11205 [Roseiflexaceae bacterium]